MLSIAVLPRPTLLAELGWNRASIECAFWETLSLLLDVRAKNLGIFLDRIENAKNFSLRMVKASKKKGKHAEIAKVWNAENSTNA